MGIHFNVDLSFHDMKYFVQELIERQVELMTLDNYESVIVYNHRVQKIKNKLEVY